MNNRLKFLVLIGLLIALTALTTLPQIIEAKRSKPSANNNYSGTVGLPLNIVQNKRSDVVVGSSDRNDTSIPVREMKQLPMGGHEKREAAKNPKVPHSHKDVPDPVVQSSVSGSDAISTAIPTPGSFDGISFPGVACNCAPPDTNGEVGATQYVQIVNEGFQVFDKTTGASLLGPSGITTLWQGFGGVCENSGDGDPVVLYDQLADRWVITQFAGASVPTDECIAVSTTGDATGSYHRYAYHLGSNFFDYPHLGVWPDAYYMSMNVFNSSGTSFLGPQPFAFDRSKMLAGLPGTFITTGITGGSSEEVYLPADLEGGTLPPAGAPGIFVEWPGNGTYRVFRFHADFATPGNSTFTLAAAPAAAGFTGLCPLTRSCVPQPSTTSRLDAIADRLMFRLSYRNFGTYDSVVGNFTVSANNVAGIRWFELRNTVSGPVTTFQDSTYQPDATWRWLGAAAMDRDGNIAIGYSASSASVFPSLRYAGRLASDPVNTLGQEATLFAGLGSQSGTSSRWGDYSSLTVDPIDDCTFWFTSEYYPTGVSSFNWRTRIGSFRFGQCGSQPTPTPTPTPEPTPTPTPAPTAPVAPSNLIATPVSTTQINLVWTDNSNNETGFTIERCTGNGCTNFAPVPQSPVGADVTTFSDSGLVANTRYRYRVRAFNAIGNSAYSNIAQARTDRR